MRHPTEYAALHKALEGKMLSAPTILHVDFANFETLRAPVLDVHFVRIEPVAAHVGASADAYGVLVEDPSLLVVVTGSKDGRTDPTALENEVEGYRVPVTVQSWPEKS